MSVSTAQYYHYGGMQSQIQTDHYTQIGLGHGRVVLTTSAKTILNSATNSSGEVVNLRAGYGSNLRYEGWPGTYTNHGSDVVILSLLLCNVSEYDEQVEITSGLETSFIGASTRTIKTGSIIPDNVWIPQGTSLQVIDRDNPWHFPFADASTVLQARTINNTDSVHLTMLYGLIGGTQ